MSDLPITVDVFWRKGCGACASMRVTLAEAGVPAEWHDIWGDPDAAAFVRSVAGGNETVPTVCVGETILVAPRRSHLLGVLQGMDPALVASTRRWPPLRVIQWVAITALLVAGIVVSGSGHSSLSWLANGAAVAVYLGLRCLRSRPPRRATSSHLG